MTSGPADAAPPAEPRARPRRGRVLGMGAVVAVVLAGGAVSAVLLRGGESVSLSSGLSIALPEAVTSRPSEVWDVRTDGAVTGGAAVGESLVLSTESTVLALDVDGEEQWSVSPSEPCGVVLSHPDHEDVVMCVAEAGVLGLDAADGAQEWDFGDGVLAHYSDEGAGFVGDASLGLMDPGTGETIWSTDVTDDYAFSDDAVYTSEGGSLTRLDLATGEEDWTIDYGGAAASGSPAVHADAAVVLVTDDAGATAYDPEDGAILWTAEPGPDGVEGGVFGDGLVYVLPSGGPITVYDEEGEVGDLETDDDTSYASITPFEVDGEPFAIDYVSGRVYDGDLATVGTYTGAVTLLDGGLYVATDPEDGAGGTVAYYDLGADDPTWTLDVDATDRLDVAAVDGLVIVVTGDRVLGYR